MIIDSSALMAIFLNEPEAGVVAATMFSAERRLISAPNWLEVCIVVDRRSVPGVSEQLAKARSQLNIDVVPFDSGMAELARDAFQRYGRGSQHPAKLNFDDCMAYALAKSTGEPLLFKGNDFVHTDITPAMR